MRKKMKFERPALRILTSTGLTISDAVATVRVESHDIQRLTGMQRKTQATPANSLVGSR